MFNYDFPLSPRARTYLKLERLIKCIEESNDYDSVQHIMLALRCIVDFIDIVDGSSAIKIDLLKDLERCDGQLKKWEEDSECDTEYVETLRDKIKNARLVLDSFTRQRTVLKDDPIIELIKPRFLTPGGINCFDTPMFDYWINQTAEKKKICFEKWLHEIDCIKVPVYTILYLWRLCANYTEKYAKQGFMQETADTCDLINIQYDESVAAYPVVSGFQSRVNIRFLPFEKGAPVGDVPFKIAYIKGNLQQ